VIAALGRRLRRADDDDGITLVELLVSTMLGILIMIVAGALMVSTSRASGVQAASDLNSRSAATAMNTMSRYLHATTTYPTAAGTQPAFAGMSATDVTFYAYVNLVNTDAKPVKVRYYVDANKHLIQLLYPSTCSGTPSYCAFSATSAKTDLGGPVVSPTSDGTALFAYLTAGGDPTTDACSVQSVQVNLEYGAATAGAAGNAHLTNTVALLNVGQFGGNC
jgi:Tfp pilus assembly protein PilX